MADHYVHDGENGLIDDVTEQRFRYYTSCPADYDYSYVNVLDSQFARTRHGGVIRCVTIPKEYFGYQTERYLSGGGTYLNFQPGELGDLIDCGAVIDNQLYSEV